MSKVSLIHQMLTTFLSADPLTMAALLNEIAPLLTITAPAIALRKYSPSYLVWYVHAADAEKVRPPLLPL